MTERGDERGKKHLLKGRTSKVGSIRKKSEDVPCHQGDIRQKRLTNEICVLGIHSKASQFGSSIVGLQLLVEHPLEVISVNFFVESLEVDIVVD